MSAVELLNGGILFQNLFWLSFAEKAQIKIEISLIKMKKVQTQNFPKTDSIKYFFANKIAKTAGA
jgi:hypothetical protein